MQVSLYPYREIFIFENTAAVMQLAFFLQLGEGFFHILDENGLHVRIVVSRKYLFRGKCGDPLDRGQIGGRIGGECRIKRPAPL